MILDDTFASPAASGRPSWSGLLLFRLVGIPLKAFPAVRTRDLPTAHLLHAGCGQRIRYAKHCPQHGPVDPSAIVRGIEYGRGQHLLLDADELDAFRSPQDRALRLERFLESGQVDPLLFSGRGLYLVPDGTAASPAYGVLHQAMVQRSRWALGRMILGGHRQLVLVRPAKGMLVLHVLQYPEQLRACPQGAASPAAQPELDLAGQLIDAAGGEMDWSAYRDQAAEDWQRLIAHKLEGLPGTEAEAPVPVLPLMQALQQSLENGTAKEPARAQRKSPVARPRRRRTA
jgi:DNA end-binding protein Ku